MRSITVEILSSDPAQSRFRMVFISEPTALEAKHRFNGFHPHFNKKGMARCRITEAPGLKFF
ncbi:MULTISPECIES: hypothetical protein [Paraburkholderia]|uniref:hypothetical protein n=1 Tax=Paraburkholderia TaxID=1822464 RepID=UPI000B8206AF|nr:MULTISPECIES: hypothetical protein [Paraburkholderia]MBB5501263.1 hypothetical protein [Paraburkholderia sp. MM5384-R2]